MLRLLVFVWETLTLPLLWLWRPHRNGSACIVLDGAQRVLLVRQTYRDGWHLPGGGVKRRESLPDAACREAWEETGVVVEEPFELWGVYTHLGRRYTDHIAIYVMRHWHRIDRQSFEIAETGFFPLDALPDGVTRGVRRRLDEVAGRAPKSLYWTGEPGGRD